MISRVNSVVFQGISVLDVDLQVQISSGLPSFTIVGLPDKSIAESKERVRAALNSIGLSLPPKRITINLAPADLYKEGSHFDLAVAVGILISMNVLPVEELANYTIMGELGLDGSIISVNGILPAAMKSHENNKGLICPTAQGGEAAWSGLQDIIPAPNLLSLINHFKGSQLIARPRPEKMPEEISNLDMSDIKGQEMAKKALEIAAAGNHNLLMVGPPGSGKSMLAQRLPTILPPLSPLEVLETSMIKSIAGELKSGKLSISRPFRAPHHSASTPSLIGGGRNAKPGEISLAHNGVLFLDELPEFNRTTLDSLRQPLENGTVSVSRVNSHITYPANFQLIAAMNPCKCGYLGTHNLECNRAPKCAEEYQNKISGPLLDRIDIHIEVPAVNPWDLSEAPKGETSKEILQRVLNAREIQKNRFLSKKIKHLTTNSQLSGNLLEEFATPDNDGKALLINVADKLNLSARAYHRILKLSRTLADLQNEEKIRKIHIAEALSYRRMIPGRSTIGRS